ncbi:MAG: hypothetical protein AABY38_00375 [Planctomycetota bacterium]
MAGSHGPIRKDVCHHTGAYAAMFVAGRFEIKICVILADFCFGQVWIKMDKSAAAFLLFFPGIYCL